MFLLVSPHPISWFFGEVDSRKVFLLSTVQSWDLKYTNKELHKSRA